jgi:hypothetical protein
MTPRRLPLHQELYLFAHDRNGTPAIHLPSLSVGLGAAALADLVLTDRLAISAGRLVVRQAVAAGEPVTDSILAAVAATATRDLGHWLRGVAGNIYERATGALVAAGLLTVGGRRRRYRPADPTQASVACARMRWATYGHEYPDPQCAALCGLTAVLRLERGLHLDEPSADVVARLSHLGRVYFPAGNELVDAVAYLVAEAAVSVYR